MLKARKSGDNELKGPNDHYRDYRENKDGRRCVLVFYTAQWNAETNLRHNVKLICTLMVIMKH